MKFSQFEDRQKLERELLECVDYLNSILWSGIQQKHYLVLPKLNLILRSDISLYLFLDITKEYRSNKKFHIRAAAHLYIFAIIFILILKLGRFFFKGISLEGSDFYPVIIGGNNRLRFVDSSNSNALLIAKNPNSLLFTKNAVRAFCKSIFSDMDIIPRLLPINDRVYLEEQIEALAINRKTLTDVENEIINKTLEAFYVRQEDSSRDITIKSYFRYKRQILRKFSVEIDLPHISNLYKLFCSFGNKVEQHFGPTKISVCPSHGDLNRGNVFLNQDRVMIIDWEYFMYRYTKYDSILFKYDLRHQPLSAYLDFLKENNSDFNVILFLLEELFFRILNFKEDVPDSQLYVDTLVELIEKKLLIEKLI